MGKSGRIFRSFGGSQRVNNNKEVSVDNEEHPGQLNNEELAALAQLEAAADAHDALDLDALHRETEAEFSHLPEAENSLGDGLGGDSASIADATGDSTSGE